MFDEDRAAVLADGMNNVAVETDETYVADTVRGSDRCSG